MLPRLAVLALVAFVAPVTLAGCGGEPGVEAGAAASPADDPADGNDDVSTATSMSAGATTAPATAAPTTATAPRVETVAVVGDSLTESAAEQLLLTLDGAGLEVVALDGLTNRRMVRSGSGVEPGTEAITEVLATLDEPPDLWVIALGTNDVGGSATPAEIEADMRALLEGLPADAPVVWVDVWIRDRPDQVVAANAVIRDVLRSRGSATVVDWYTQGSREGVITDDGVHLTDDGRWIFAREITDAVLAHGTSGDAGGD